jgi:6-phosphogluconolactonase/Glucosamine-6-phosphate isomerase/deaminase
MSNVVDQFAIGTLKVEVYSDRQAAGNAAARSVADSIMHLSGDEEQLGIVFATGASQLPTLRALTSIDNLPWNSVVGFHLDEYLGLHIDHLASFRKYLREELVNRVPLARFFEIDGNSPDVKSFMRDYAQSLHEIKPRLCLLGIGENGHLAFNDPSEANFEDPEAMKVVSLDSACRQQQVAEGWFGSIEEVPAQALTLTIPTIMSIPRLVVSVPGKRKAECVRRTLEEPMSTSCPATILRCHPDVTLYLDAESASELSGIPKSL